MGMFGFDSFGDMFDGGGAGRSGPTSSFEGSVFDSDRVNNYSAPTGAAATSGGSALSTIGSLVGLLAGGPSGAALGAGIGSLLGGGSFGDALKSGAGTYLTGALGGGAGIITDALQGGKGSMAAGNSLGSIFGGQTTTEVGPDGKPVAAPGGLAGIMKAFDNPLMMAALLKATEPKNVSVTSPEDRARLETGERNSTYEGTAAPDYRYQGLARGGIVQGPGTGTSDSIPARIYQNGKPVREARLSDGEFVMTHRAVRGAGGGDRAKGAAEMYRMMRQFERRA